MVLSFNLHWLYPFTNKVDCWCHQPSYVTFCMICTYTQGSWPKCWDLYCVLLSRVIISFSFTTRGTQDYKWEEWGVKPYICYNSPTYVRSKPNKVLWSKKFWKEIFFTTYLPFFLISEITLSVSYKEIYLLSKQYQCYSTKNWHQIALPCVFL